MNERPTIRRRFVWSNWVLLFLGVGIAILLDFAVSSLRPFLAINHPMGEGVLAVEAWIPGRSLAESMRVFNSGHYQYLVLVGGPIGSPDPGEPTTFPDRAAQRLEKLGFDPDKLVKINVAAEPAGYRTLSNAAAVARWLARPGNSVCCVDVFTLGTHARKSWVFFRDMLGDRVRVGIIAGSDSFYDRHRWWFLSPRGALRFVPNLVGYAYAKFWVFIHPGTTAQSLHTEMTAQTDSEAHGGISTRPVAR